MKINKNVLRIVYIIFSILLFASFLSDILITSGKIKIYFFVSDYYLSSVFSGILTFSTLSLTLLSIIVGIIDVKFCGLKLKELLFLDASPIKFISFIAFSMLLTFFSVIALTFDLITFISAIAIISILNITIISLIIFKIVTNNDFAKDIIFQEITANNILPNYVVSWVNEYKNAIINSNKNDIKIYAAILKKCVKDNDLSSIVLNLLPDLFDVSCKYRSFPDAINLVFDSIGFSSTFIFDKYGIKKICENYIKHIQYSNEYELIRLNLPLKINDLLISTKIWYTGKIDLSYYFIKAIMYNNASKNIKLQILEECIKEITQFEIEKNSSRKQDLLLTLQKPEIELVKKELILKIFFQNIIKGDYYLKSELYNIIIKSLYLKNYYNRNQFFKDTIAEIFRMIYFYSSLSMEMLNDKKRQELKEFARHSILWEYSFNPLYNEIILHYKEYIHFYIKDSFKESPIIKLGIKDASEYLHNLNLWGYSTKIKFAFWFFFAFRIDEDFPLSKYLEEIKDNKDLSLRICISLLEEIKEDMTLTDSCLNNIQNLQNYFDSLSRVQYIDKKMVTNIFNEVNSKKEELENSTSSK